LERPNTWLDGGESLRLAIIRAGAAAKDCRGMNLGATVWGPTFHRIVEFVRAFFRGNALQGSDEDADLVLTAMDCGVDIVGAMGLPGHVGAEAHLGHVATAYGLTVLSGLLRIRAVLDAPDTASDLDEMAVGTASDCCSGSAERGAGAALSSS